MPPSLLLLLAPSRGRAARKRYRSVGDGLYQRFDAPRATWWRVADQIPLGGLEDLASALRRRDELGAIAVRGGLNPTAEPRRLRRAYKPETVGGPGLVAAPARWACLDFDKLPPPPGVSIPRAWRPGVEPATDRRLARGFFDHYAPPAWRGAGFVLVWSASAGWERASEGGEQWRLSAETPEQWSLHAYV